MKNMIKFCFILEIDGLNLEKEFLWNSHKKNATVKQDHIDDIHGGGSSAL